LDRQQFALAITELIALTHKMIAISVDELKTKARCKSLVDQVREFQQQFVTNRWMWHEQVTRMLLSFASVARLVEHLQWVDEARRVDDEADFDDDETTQLNSRSVTMTREFDEFDDDDDESPRNADSSSGATAVAAASDGEFRIRSPLRPITLNQMRQRISQRAAQRASTLAVSWSTADLTPHRQSGSDHENDDDDNDDDGDDENHTENDDLTVVITRSVPKDNTTPTKTAPSPAKNNDAAKAEDDDDDDDEEDTEEFEVQAPAVAEKPARQSPIAIAVAVDAAVAAPPVVVSSAGVSTSTSTSSLLTLPSDGSDITRMHWSGASSRSSGELSGGALKRSTSVTHQRPGVVAPSNRNRREKRGRTLSLAALDLSRSQSADALLERRSASPSPREPQQLFAAAPPAASAVPSRQQSTASGPVALSSGAAALRRAHTAADSRVLCRLCEERVPSFALALHSVYCVAAQRARANASESDDRLRRLETTLLRRHERELPRRPCDRKVSLLVLDELSRCVHACRAIDIERSSAERRLARLTDRVEQLTANNSSDSENEAENEAEPHRHSQILQRALLSKAQSVISRHAEIAAAFAQLPRRARKRHGKAARRRQQEVGVKDFQLVKPISKGAYGRVFLTQKSTTGDLYALKVMSKRDVRAKKQAGHIKSERNIAAHTACPYLVRFYYAFQTRINLYMVMEYLPGGDLASLLRALGRFDIDMARAYIAETVEALEYLHHAGVVHRDIKPDNLLLTAQGHLKLTDFRPLVVRSAAQGADQRAHGEPVDADCGARRRRRRLRVERRELAGRRSLVRCAGVHAARRQRDAAVAAVGSRSSQAPATLSARPTTWRPR
jgi:tRNA A-37 threonylcarbamoyl transferase component Bud32